MYHGLQWMHMPLFWLSKHFCICSLYYDIIPKTIAISSLIVLWYILKPCISIHDVTFANTQSWQQCMVKQIFEVVFISAADSTAEVLREGRAGPVWDDWVEPVWFLTPELCCLCRVFVPALQAPPVINSLDHSACSLTQTKSDGGTEGERGRQTHTVAGICWHRRTACTQKCNTCPRHIQTHSLRSTDGNVHAWSRNRGDIWLPFQVWHSQGNRQERREMWPHCELKLHVTC